MLPRSGDVVFDARRVRAEALDAFLSSDFGDVRDADCEVSLVLGQEETEKRLVGLDGAWQSDPLDKTGVLRSSGCMTGSAVDSRDGFTVVSYATTSGLVWRLWTSDFDSWTPKDPGKVSASRTMWVVTGMEFAQRIFLGM
jgi:hypothetical protein